MYFKVLEYGGAHHFFFFPDDDSGSHPIDTVTNSMNKLWDKLPAGPFTAQVMFCYSRGKTALSKVLNSSDYEEVGKLVGKVARAVNRKLKYGTVYVKIVLETTQTSLISFDDIKPAIKLTSHMHVSPVHHNRLPAALFRVRQGLDYQVYNAAFLEEMDI